MRGENLLSCSVRIVRFLGEALVARKTAVLAVRSFTEARIWLRWRVHDVRVMNFKVTIKNWFGRVVGVGVER